MYIYVYIYTHIYIYVYTYTYILHIANILDQIITSFLLLQSGAESRRDGWTVRHTYMYIYIHI